MDLNEYSLKLSKASAKKLQNEKRNKRKRKLFKNDENVDQSNVAASSEVKIFNLKFKDEDYILQSECKYTLEQFEKLSVCEEGEKDGGNLLATIKKELDEPSPMHELISLSKPRKLLFSEMS